MRIDNSAVLLFNGGASAKNKAATPNLSRMANSQASARAGIVQGETPGGYRGVFSAGTRTVKEDVFEARAITKKEDVIKETAITEQRDVHSMRDVYETRDVYEERAIYEERAVYQSDVSSNGSRDLRSFASPSNAGIDTGSDLKIKVGDGAWAEIQFESSNKISVTKGGQTQTFSYTSGNGSWRGALVNAFNSVGGGLTASISPEGKLNLTANNSQSIQLADVANGLFDFSRNLLGALGLTEGKSEAQIQGYEQVQVGSQQVLVGQEQVVVGSEQYVSGQETVITGYNREKIGERDVISGYENVHVGTKERTITGERQLIGLQKSDDYGVGYLDILDKLSSGGGLPPGYVEKLFGTLDTPESGGGGMLPPAREAYAESKSFAAREPEAANRWEPAEPAKPAVSAKTSDQTRK